MPLFLPFLSHPSPNFVHLFFQLTARQAPSSVLFSTEVVWFLSRVCLSYCAETIYAVEAREDPATRKN